MSAKVTCLECGMGDGFHYSDCSIWNHRPRRKKRPGEKVGDLVEEIIDTIGDFIDGLLKG